MVGFVNAAREAVRAARRPKLVVAKMELDTEQPFRDWGLMIPTVTFSMSPDHPRGCRLVWGDVAELLKRGYNVELLP